MKYIKAWGVVSLPAMVFGLGLCHAARRADAAMSQQTLPLPMTPGKQRHWLARSTYWQLMLN